MPGGDRRGPLGFGPMSGRGGGWCSGYGAPGYANQMYRRGLRGGQGRRGFRHFYRRRNIPFRDADIDFYDDAYSYEYGKTVPLTRNEKQWLSEEANALQSRLDWIKKRLDNLESKET